MVHGDLIDKSIIIEESTIQYQLVLQSTQSAVLPDSYSGSSRGVSRIEDRGLGSKIEDRGIASSGGFSAIDNSDR